MRLLASVRSAEEAAAEAGRRADRAEAESLVDPLTGLANRRAWVRSLAIEEARCKRFDLPATVVVIDLDDLKEINDARGHAAGDEVLRRAGETILSQMRSHDVVARLGGDEFGALAVDCGEEAASVLGLRLSEKLGAEGIGASIGMASLPDHADLEETWHAADLAMYSSKHARKPDVAISDREPHNVS